MRAAFLLIGFALVPCACAEAITLGDGFSDGTDLDGGRTRDAASSGEDATGAIDTGATMDAKIGKADATMDAQSSEDATFEDASVTDSGPIDSGRPDAAVDAGRPDAAVDAGRDAGRPDAAVDAGRPDAAVDAGRDVGVDAGPPPYALGQPCGTAAGVNCPAGWTCTRTDSTHTEAFCTRGCNTDADCRQGQTGAGRPECLLANQAGDQFCAFACTTSCPLANLTCSDLDGDFFGDTCTERR
jgi:hypothetical protein